MTLNFHYLHLPGAGITGLSHYGWLYLFICLFIYFIYVFEAVSCNVVASWSKLAKLTQFDFKLPLGLLASGITCVSHHEQINILILKS